jgi:DNA-binding MarR family transcriptional regulator
MSMKEEKKLAELNLDKLVHERTRLMILTHLASSGEAETGFPELKSALGLSAGNLSIQLKTLEEAGYLSIQKSFRNNKPFTAVTLSPKGKKALEAYLGELEFIVASLRGERKDQ